MSEWIRKWLGLDQLATRDDIHRMLDARTFSAHQLKPHKIESVAEPISFEEMQARALEQSNEDAA